MSEYISFEGRIEPMEWGRKTYTILRLPQDVADAFEAQGAKRVEGEINDVPVNLALTRAPVIDGLFLWAGQSFLREVGLEPGQETLIRLRKADPNVVEMPEDLAAALREAGKTAQWEALSAGKRRGMLYQVNAAKRAETRAKRIAKLVDGLS